MTELDKEIRKLKEEYVPIDFSSYTIEDSQSAVLSKRGSEAGIPQD